MIAQKALRRLLGLLGQQPQIEADVAMLRNSRLTSEVFPVCRAPVTMTAGNAAASRSIRSPMSRSIHMNHGYLSIKTTICQTTALPGVRPLGARQDVVYPLVT